MNKLLVKLIDEDRIRTQMMNISDERGHVITDLTDIKKVIGNIINNFMPIKCNNLG